MNEDSDWLWVCADDNAVLVEAKAPEEMVIKALEQLPDDEKPDAISFIAVFRR